MATCLPSEPVYHYECSAGSFRLVYFIPREMLEELRASDLLSEKALQDFPDGVDLGCTEWDFADFAAEYGWRPEVSPDDMRRVFFALLSSTRHWKSFRGAGRIPARDLEQHIEPVTAELESLGEEPRLEPARAPGAPAQRRRRAAYHRKMRRTLELAPVEDVDPGRDLKRQAFSQVEMQPEGDSAEVVFSRVHEKRRR